jgi:hypothetical protein
MSFAVCRLSHAPMRREPDVVSEMVNEVRGGEAVEVLGTAGKFWRARLLVDDYEGWVDSRQFGERGDGLPLVATHVTDDHCGEATMGDWAMAMPLGSPLPGYDGETFLYGEERWTWKGKVREIPKEGTVPDVAELLHYARRYLRTPYLWGGRTVFGVDCSGFASSVLRAFGVEVRRDCVQQIEGGMRVPDLASAVPGDLVYFAPSGEAAQHVGIVLPCGEVIHSSAMVRIDDLTERGIVNRESGELTHRLKAVRRYIAWD